MIYRLPPYFYGDHCDRGLPSGRIVRTTKTSVFVELDASECAEMLASADYYVDQTAAMLDSDPAQIGLISSARATAKALRKQGA